MEGYDEMGVADNGCEMELLAGDIQDAVPAEAAAAVLGEINEMAHEIAEGVEVGLAGKIVAREDGAFDESGGGEDAGLAGEKIGGAFGLGSGGGSGWRGLRGSGLGGGFRGSCGGGKEAGGRDLEAAHPGGAGDGRGLRGFDKGGLRGEGGLRRGSFGLGRRGGFRRGLGGCGRRFGRGFFGYGHGCLSFGRFRLNRWERLCPGGRLVRARGGFRKGLRFDITKRFGRGVERGHVEEVIRGETLENLVERNPDFGPGDGTDELAEIFGEGFVKGFDWDFHVAVGKLGLDGGERERHARALRREHSGLENRR